MIKLIKQLRALRKIPDLKFMLGEVYGTVNTRIARLERGVGYHAKPEHRAPCSHQRVDEYTTQYATTTSTSSAKMVEVINSYCKLCGKDLSERV